jgi:hypothetical protein
MLQQRHTEIVQQLQAQHDEALMRLRSCRPRPTRSCLCVGASRPLEVPLFDHPSLFPTSKPSIDLSTTAALSWLAVVADAQPAKTFARLVHYGCPHFCTAVNMQPFLMALRPLSSASGPCQSGDCAPQRAAGSRQTLKGWSLSVAVSRPLADLSQCAQQMPRSKAEHTRLLLNTFDLRSALRSLAIGQKCGREFTN